VSDVDGAVIERALSILWDWA